MVEHVNRAGLPPGVTALICTEATGVKCVLIRGSWEMNVTSVHLITMVTSVVSMIRFKVQL